MEFEKWWLCVGKKCGSENGTGSIKLPIVKLIAKSAHDNGRFEAELEAYRKAEKASGG